jgi:hypothetical protein
LRKLEIELMDAVKDLQKRKRICGTAPTLEDLLNPVEDVIGRTGLEFLGDDDEIIAEAIQTALGDHLEEDTEDECNGVGRSDEKMGLEEAACKSSALITLTPMVYHCWRYRSSFEGCWHISAILLINLLCGPLLISSGVSSPSHEAALIA